jgi:hypothetical protein
MSNVRTFDFGELSRCDLVVDATYRGGSAGNAGDDPLARLVACGNQGGFRIGGNRGRHEYRFAVIYSSLDDPDWPDHLDFATGAFVYFGDNKKPGRELLDTPRGGNRLLDYCFGALHTPGRSRVGIPPFFVFTRGASGRDVVFRGLAVPGSPVGGEDLVAVWRTSGDHRFQNYRAVFTILNVPVVHRAWLDDLAAGNPYSANAPRAWLGWTEGGRAAPLISKPTVETRSIKQQKPAAGREAELVEVIYRYFKTDPYAFEVCAARMLEMMDDNVIECEVTRSSRDGGRDAVGKYRIGAKADGIAITFAMEAKCYALSHGVGVKATSRLISRLRHREFGFLVTTSYLDPYAYKEIREDQQPIIVISGGDIARIVTEAGLGTGRDVQRWLETEFPHKVAPEV